VRERPRHREPHARRRSTIFHFRSTHVASFVLAHLSLLNSVPFSSSTTNRPLVDVIDWNALMLRALCACQICFDALPARCPLTLAIRFSTERGCCRCVSSARHQCVAAFRSHLRAWLPTGSELDGHGHRHSLYLCPSPRSGAWRY